MRGNRGMAMRIATLVGALGLVAACGGAEVRGENDEDDFDDAEGGGAHTGEIQLAVVPKAVGFDFWQDVRDGAECAADEFEDVSMQWDGVAAETDVTGQVNLLQNFITQGVDALVYAATDARVLADVSEQAQAQGITVVNIDSGTDPQPDDVAVFATDNEQAAQEAAQLLADTLGEGEHEIALIPFQPGTSTNDQRMTGFKRGLEDLPQLEDVAEQSSQSDYNEGLRVTEDILTANPDLAGIFAANEPGALGAAEAVRRAGQSDEVAIVGWDAAEDQIESLEDGTIDALVVQNPFRMGYEAVEAAVLELREGTAPQSTDTGVTFVTRDNLNSDEVQSVLNPSCDDPPTE